MRLWHWCHLKFDNLFFSQSLLRVEDAFLELVPHVLCSSLQVSQVHRTVSVLVEAALTLGFELFS